MFMDVVKTDSGYISGTVLGEPDKPVHVYRGIQYSAPPVGNLRWKPPQPVAAWSGIRECTVFSAVAPQSLLGAANPSGGMPQSEDCLYLNVLTTAKEAGERLPVMAWMHGGALTGGSGNEKHSNGPGLPLKGVVLVTVNMRLGPMGLLAHPLLSRESPQGVSGNYLFLDMVAALTWVQKNIAAFGGDPDNVTIFGESGGSFKVVELMASPLAKGLFHRAIGESGVATKGLHPGVLLKEMEARGETFFAKLGVDKEKDPLAAARALPWERIIEAGQHLTTALKLRPGWGPWDSVIDGWFLPDTSADIFLAGKQNVVPFIMGANLGELTGPGFILMPQVIPGYLNLFRGGNKAGGKAYAYIFDHVPAGWKRDGAVSAHALELPYVFGDLDYSDNCWAALCFLAKASGAKSTDPGLTDKDRELSEVMMRLWTNFAKTGDPSLKGLVEWPAYEESTDQYLYITDTLQVKSGFSRIAQK
jgi:para-nitrobenzyl esterase